MDIAPRSTVANLSYSATIAIAVATASTTQQKLSLDPTYPLFLNASDSSGLVIVSFTLTRSDNYALWSRAMRIAQISRRVDEAMTVSEIVWIVGVLTELGLKNITPVKLFCDNKTAIQIASNPMFHERTKHIVIDSHRAREKLQERLIIPKHVKTQEQPAEILTKALGYDQHQALMSKLGIKDIFTASTGGGE